MKILVLFLSIVSTIQSLPQSKFNSDVTPVHTEAIVETLHSYSEPLTDEILNNYYETEIDGSSNQKSDHQQVKNDLFKATSTIPAILFKDKRSSYEVPSNNNVSFTGENYTKKISITPVTGDTVFVERNNLSENIGSNSDAIIVTEDMIPRRSCPVVDKQNKEPAGRKCYIARDQNTVLNDKLEREIESNTGNLNTLSDDDIFKLLEENPPSKESISSSVAPESGKKRYINENLQNIDNNIIDTDVSTTMFDDDEILLLLENPMGANDTTNNQTIPEKNPVKGETDNGLDFENIDELEFYLNNTDLSFSPSPSSTMESTTTTPDNHYTETTAIVDEDNLDETTDGTLDRIDEDYTETVTEVEPDADVTTEMGKEEIEKEEINTEPIEAEASWNDSHPCNYRHLEHTININKEGKRVSEIQCEYHMWQYKYEILEMERKNIECVRELKKRNESVTEVVGGLKARQGDFPHMGAVGWRKQDSSYKFMCGSSLISKRFAITVAHCSAISEFVRITQGLASVRPEVVRFGSVNIQRNSHPGGKFVYEDVNIDGPLILLPKYKFLYKYNDIALIRLEDDVELKLNVRPACLWNGPLNGHTVGNVTGWGHTKAGGVSGSAYLLYAELDFIDRSYCKNALGKLNIRNFQGIMDHQFCAAKLSGEVDTCQGDSGGPLQIQVPLPSHIDTGIMQHVVGLTSFGIGCARPNTPGVYVNVSDPSLLCWIEKTVWPEEANPFCPDETFEGFDVPLLPIRG